VDGSELDCGCREGKVKTNRFLSASQCGTGHSIVWYQKCVLEWRGNRVEQRLEEKRREGKGREGKGREGKRREGKRREEKGREEKKRKEK